MHMYLNEKIGNPDLFTGRKAELRSFLQWINNIPRLISPSTAILSRRKTGKTALLQRLYNLTFEQNGGVIPFYYEVKEGNQWIVEFCKDFFLTFIFQYIAFQSRKPEYIRPLHKDFPDAVEAARREGLDFLVEAIEGIQTLSRDNLVSYLWQTVKEMPLTIAIRRNECIVQMIDEFQYLNSEIYRDEACTNLMDDCAAGYMSTAEYKNAPLLISGSWVGWLRDMLHTMLSSRFHYAFLENMPDDEALEMVYKYAQVLNIPVAEDVAYALAQVSEGNPFYISAVFLSECSEKDLTTSDGLVRILDFETMNGQGNIRGVWMEYLSKVFYKVNERHAKRIVLYLCQHRGQEVSRQELMTALQLEMTEMELENKLDALIRSDIIEQGRSNFYYQSVQDNIFDKVFRGVYADDIKNFDPHEVTTEYRALYEHARKNYQELLGRYNQTKGIFAEFAIINQLRLHAHRQPARFLAITQNVPADFTFVPYQQVWSYKTARADRQDIAIDIFARAGVQEYSLIGEVKNRDTKPFTVAEAEAFVQKAQTLRTYESIGKAVLFVFSRKGFTDDTLAYFQAQHIAYSSDERWLGE
jgi:hypothetical protein